MFSLNKKTYSRSALEIPPDLLDSSSDAVRKNQRDGTQSDGTQARVLPKVIGVKIHNKNNQSWLAVQADATVVWDKLTDFWASQDVKLVEYEPKSGIMVTEWFNRTNASQAKGVTSIAIALIRSIASSTSVEQFTLRLQRNSTGGTNVFVSHRGREKVSKVGSSPKESTGLDWAERGQDAEKVSQLLQVLVQFFAPS